MKASRLFFITLACGWMALLSSDLRPRLAKTAADAAHLATARRAYGQLPLLFETNRGQTDRHVRYVARGGGYTVFLQPAEAVLRLQTADESTAALRLQLVGARDNAPARGLVRSETAITYLRGKSRQVVESFERVSFQQVWPGIDVVYHGAQRQLEYDFALRAGANPDRIKLQFDGLAAPPQRNAVGELVLNVAGREVRWRKPVAWQMIDGKRCEIACEYQLESAQRFGFKLGNYDRRRPLVIDPALVYSTLLGGTLTETATGIAVDAAGNAYVCGTTFSLNYPAVNALRANKESSNTSDAFVAKLNAAGTALIYSTFLGGSNSDTGNAIAVDASGSAYVAGFTLSADFPSTAGALQTTLKGSSDGFVVKLNPQGSALTYATLLGGNNTDGINGLALDGNNNVYLTGQTESFDFPTASAATAKSGAALFKSANNGQQWNASANGLTAASLLALAQDPLTATTLYGISSQGLYKSTDNGATWNFVGAPPLVQNARATVLSFAIDPKAPATIYLGTNNGIYKSTNSGQAFQLLSAAPLLGINALAIDPQTTTTVYAATIFGVYKTTNGGEAWANSTAAGVNVFVRKLVIDPTNPAVLYAATNRGILRTADRANSWSFINTGFSGTPDILALDIDPAAPNTLYAYSNFSLGTVYKTTNGGASWQASTGFLQAQFNTINFRTNCFGFAINGSRVLAATLLGVFLSTDGGNSWIRNEEGLPVNPTNGFLQDRTNPNVVFAAVGSGSDAFVTKLNATGSALVYSRYLGGESLELGRSIAVDSSGNAWLTGQTASANFPTVNPTQARYGFMTDIFVTKVNASGAALSFSTYLGGTSGELGNGLALDGAGNAYVAGWTQSLDFPVVNALIASAPAGFNAIVAKYKADGSAIDYSTYLGGSRNDQAFAITADSAGNTLIAGTTASPDFPVIGSLQPYNPQNFTGHVFLTRLNPDGRRVGFSTFLGGSTSDQANAVTLDAQGNVYLAGTTQSQDFPVVNPLQGLSGISDAFIAKLSPSADLALTMTAAPEPVAFGANLTYTLRVTNNGELRATGVTLTDTLPSGATLVSATTTQGSCAGTVTVTCNLGALNVSAAATVTLVIRPPAQLKISNTANVTANEADGNLTNNRATVESKVNFYDLAVTVTPFNERVVSGGRAYFLVNAANRNGDPVSNVVVNFTLPAGLTHVSCLPEFGTCGGTGNNRTMTIASLNVGQMRAATFVATVNSPAAAGMVLTVNASIEPNGLDVNRANNTTSAAVTVSAAAELVRLKANGKIVFASGRAFTNSTEPSGLYQINSDGTGEAVIRSTIGEAYRPVWSPDGAQIAYVAYNDTGQGDALYLINADGSNKRKIASDAAGRQHNHSWSPNGKQIIYVSGGTLAFANADGSGTTRMPNSPSQIADVDWSPDGSQLAVARNGNIVILTLDGVEQRSISSPTTALSAPRWSPDGARLLLQGTTTNRTDAYLVNADGTDLTRAFNLFNSGSPAWSPDARRITFISLNELHVIGYDGTNLTKLTNKNFYNFSPHWQPVMTTQNLQPPIYAPTVSVAGRAFNEAGEPLSSLPVQITGSVTATVFPEEPNGNEVGRFRFVRLPRGGNYTLTPQDPAYRYEPASRTYNNLTSDVTGADFKAIFRPYSIRGRVTDAAGLPIAGVPFASLAFTGPIETDENGQYAYLNLTGGANYAVAPRGQFAGDLFQPPSVQFNNLIENKTADFVGRREFFDVNCRALDAAGNAVAGATVTLTSVQGSTTFNRTATTNEAGLASFLAVPGGFPYTFKVSKTGHSFLPAERRVVINHLTDVTFYSGVTAAAVVSAASFRPTDVALGGILAVFGTNLAPTTKVASVLASELEGVTVQATGRNYQQNCLLFFVSPQQINLYLPPSFDNFNPPPTELLLTVQRDGRTVATVAVNVRKSALTLFAANANGQGLAAAVALRVKSDGTQSYEPIVRFDPATNRFVAVPLDVSNATEQVFLILFGSGLGFRPYFRTDLNVKVANQNCELFYAGAQGSLIGLDQLNVLLPRTLAGRGEADVTLTAAEGGAANLVKIFLR